MLQFILQRRDELRDKPETRAEAVQTFGVGSGGNTAHLNKTVPLAPLPKSMIAIIKGKKK